MHHGIWLGEKNNQYGRKEMAKRKPVSTLTHTTREVALDFLRWREEQKQASMIGHNGCPFDDEIDVSILNSDRSPLDV